MPVWPGGLHDDWGRVQRRASRMGRHMAGPRPVPSACRRRIPCGSHRAATGLADSLTPVGFYERLAGGRSGTFILESAEYGGSWSRYSFIGVNSMAQLRSDHGKANWLGQVPAGVPTEGDVIEVAHAALKVLKAPHVAGLPNLTSGLVGSVGWDAHPPLGAQTARRAPDETGQPEVTLALATDIAVVDHVSGSVWLIANAVNVDDRPTRADAAYDEAIERLDAMQRKAATRWRGGPRERA